MNSCDNSWHGGFIAVKLTDIVEEAVYKEFDAISERGGVLGAMDTMYQRGKIQEESMYYSVFDQGGKKHDGSLPLIGVNTFLPKDGRRHRHHHRTDPLDRRRKEPADPQRRDLPRKPQWICAGKFEAATADGAGSMGSHHVHGTWASLMRDYLIEDEDGLHPRPFDEPRFTQDVQYRFSMLLVLDALLAFVDCVVREGEDRTALLSGISAHRDLLTEIYDRA